MSRRPSSATRALDRAGRLLLVGDVGLHRQRGPALVADVGRERRARHGR
jgi:hypothetical protein